MLPPDGHWSLHLLSAVLYFGTWYALMWLTWYLFPHHFDRRRARAARRP